jgi:hypothetical protein
MFPGQVSQLQQQRNLPLIRKLVVEIALQERNSSVIAAAVAAHKNSEFSIVCLRVTDDNLSPDAWQDTASVLELVASGDVVVVCFEVKNARLRFDLDALDLYEDERGRLQVKRVSGPVLKK